MTQIPGWVVICVGLASFFVIFACLALIFIAAGMATVLRHIVAILKEIHSMLETEVRKDLLPSVTSAVRERGFSRPGDTDPNITAV